MSTSHTPGPWQCAPISYMRSKHISHWAITASEPVSVIYPNLLASEANARLIASAPELIEALEAVLPDLEHYVATHGPGPDKRLAAARAAIAKARG